MILGLLHGGFLLHNINQMLSFAVDSNTQICRSLCKTTL